MSLLTEEVSTSRYMFIIPTSIDIHFYVIFIGIATGFCRAPVSVPPRSSVCPGPVSLTVGITASQPASCGCGQRAEEVIGLLVRDRGQVSIVTSTGCSCSIPVQGCLEIFVAFSVVLKGGPARRAFLYTFHDYFYNKLFIISYLIFYLP